MKTTPTLFVSMALALSAFAATAEPLAGPDQAFVMKAAQGGMVEVRLGEVAKEKAKSPEVKGFGEMMVTDHSKANTELKALAEKKSVKVPAELDAKHKATVDRLSKLSGDEFDKAYVKEMVSDHKKDISEFEEASRAVKDPDVKGFAEKTLPTLRAHLEHIQEAQKKMGK